jgi:hypothetical protein
MDGDPLVRASPRTISSRMVNASIFPKMVIFTDGTKLMAHDE